MYVETDVVNFTLTECAEGDEVCVIGIDGDSPVAARLRALGVLDGVPIRIARAGSPLIIEVGETRLCLRGPEANGVRVCPVELAWAGYAPGAMEDASVA